MTGKKIKKLIIYTDGGARGNPGPAAAAAVIKDQTGATLGSVARCLGQATNNQAEYQGVILALEHILKANFLAEELVFYLDSQLVASQLERIYKVKDLDLQSLFVKVWNLQQRFKKVSYHHIPREKNQEADCLVNLELDKNH